MELLIHTNGMNLSERLQAYVEKKMEKLDRYLPDLQKVNVELSQRKAKNSDQRRVAQLTIRDGRGTILRAEEKNDTIYGAIDSVVGKMYRQIKRYRGREKKQRRNGDVADILAEAIPPEFVIGDNVEVEESAPSIVKRKEFSIQLMSEEEALDQMMLLDHDFFVFTNLDGDTNVLYRRKDGNVGILQPTVN